MGMGVRTGVRWWFLYSIDVGVGLLVRDYENP